jgi:pyrimidine-nucleoside phosphorylase
MHIPTIIERKREGGRLSDEEIRYFIEGFTCGDIPDYQMSALAMAIYFRGMDAEETTALTQAMLHSGSVLDWPQSAPARVDKHSTGGIGDKTSLVLAPLLACDGLWVPMISGRGLGITGGTLDKLESIPSFRTQLEEDEIRAVLAEVGCVMAGQTADICPADRKLYALRDVTGTVPSIPLITASIMSKKLAEGLDRLVLDVKYGTGAFMKSRENADALARSMVNVGKLLGVRASVRLSEMNEPTGESAGNALEVSECVRCLRGGGPADLEDIVLDLAVTIADSDRDTLRGWLHDGTAWKRFQQMVEAQEGDADVLTRLENIHHAPVIADFPAPRGGVLRRMDAGVIGQVCLELGAGRAKAGDPVDFAVGCDQIMKTGAEVVFGDPLLRIHARSDEDLERAQRQLCAGIEIV